MNRIIKLTPLFVLLFITLFGSGSYAQNNSKKPPVTKRESVRRGMRSRDSVLRALNRSDTSVSSLLQHIEQYTTSFNQINNNLSEGLDTIDISQQMPAVNRRLNKMDSLAKTHKSSTLRYLFVLRDNLDHIQTQLEDWQSAMDDINTSLIQNQKDLLKFYCDTTLRAAPEDSLLRQTYLQQLAAIKDLWHRTDSINRKSLLKVNLLQDKISIAYSKILDESDQIDAKIKRFAMRAMAGESDYIWNTGFDYHDFTTALKSTVKMNTILFNYLLKNNTYTHFLALLFFVLIFSWVFYNRAKTIKHNDDANAVFERATYVQKAPIASSLLIGLAIVPYFYSHPPAVFLEVLFISAIIIALSFVKNQYKGLYQFFFRLFWLTLVYGASNLFIQISNIDRYAILLLSIASIAIGWLSVRDVKKSPDKHLEGSLLALQIFIGLHILSIVFNLSGRFSLAKIVGITAVFNLWLVVIFYLLVNIVLQCLYLQFQTAKDSKSIINWIDFNIVEKKFRSILVTLASLLWTFTFLQNLNIDDWAQDWLSDVLNEQRNVAGVKGASFTFGGFLIFIAVIWLSSIISRIISYFYEVSGQRVTDLSVFKKKNRTSALIIRMGVFSVGFLLAVAASGFPLEKLTIIISAFGVGIGFGLQNIVNNLVSGLILAFEKPINIGDVIEVDGRSGTMKEIGIRSSRILTGEGSEVIIPNGDLISRHVINWTLSNNNRRIELTITVVYGAEIDKIKDLIKSILNNRDDIMTDPAPAVFLNGVNESKVEFKVLFWEADISTTSELKSRILAEIYQSFQAEGIELPSSQKDYYLHFPEGIPVVNSDQKAKEA